MRAVVFSAVLIVCLSLRPSVAETVRFTIAALPQSIANNIQTKYPGWRPVRISDLESDDQQLWTKVHGDLCPGIASGHFESHTRTTYAVLLISSIPSRQGYKFLLFNKAPGASRSILLASAEGANAGQPVISRVPPGKYSDPETGESVDTKMDSVLIEWIEAAAQLFYWTGSRYQKLQVQD